MTTSLRSLRPHGRLRAVGRSTARRSDHLNQPPVARQSSAVSQSRRATRRQRRRRSSATPGCGSCRPAEVLPTRQVVRQRLPPRHELDSGLHQRRRLRRHVRGRHQGSRRDLRLVPRRHAHRPRHAAACSSTIRASAASSIAIRASTRTGPATTSATSTSARRSTSGPRSPEPGGARAARHGQAADRRQRTSASAPGKPTCSIDLIVSKEAAKLVEVPASAATNSAAARRLRHSDRRVPLGRGRRRSRRATSCASSAS